MIYLRKNSSDHQVEPHWRYLFAAAKSFAKIAIVGNFVLNVKNSTTLDTTTVRITYIWKI